MKNEIILYQAEESSNRVEVIVDHETVWLNRKQMANLFHRDVKTIGKHVNNALKEELNGISVVANFATTATDGKTYQVEHYNLDVIISVGYRVKSKQGSQFRIWANKILKNYLLKGYSLNQRMNRLENNMDRIAKHVEGIDLQISTNSLPTQGVFFKGQIFDAYKFVSDLIRSAKKSIILIDNYIDDTVLAQLSKKNKEVKVLILTQQISKQFALDIKKVNAQYPQIKAQIYKHAHDRFLIIDKTEIYHIGASLKDLGKKLFAFSKIESSVLTQFLNELKTTTKI
jgi:hypothetical protein